MPIPINKKFEPVYRNKDKRYILLTGGRGSSKTWNLSLFAKRLSYEADRVILYVRYTMKSAADSIIPEVKERMIDEGDWANFKVTKTDVHNLFSGSEIMFRGIKTQSGNQLGILKGIKGLSVMIGDEMQEWESESDFEDLDDSIRQKGVQNMVILIMNPTDDGHFIYEKFIKDTHRIEMIDGVPVQISTHPDVLHIHTTYLDNLEHLDKSFLAKIQKSKEQHDKLPDEKKQHSKYSTKIIGRWTDIPEGVIIKNVEYADADAFDRSLPYAFGLDFGFHPDPDVCNKVAVDTKRKLVYVQEMFHQNGMSYGDLNRRFSRIATPNDLIVCDTNDGRARNELVTKGFHVAKAKKGAGSVAERYKAMNEYTFIICGESPNTKEGFRKHKWSDKKAGIPENKFKHHPDAVGYAFDYLTATVSLW